MLLELLYSISLVFICLLIYRLVVIYILYNSNKKLILKSFFDFCLQIFQPETTSFFDVTPVNAVAQKIVSNYLKNKAVPTKSKVFDLDSKIVTLANRQVKIYFRKPDYEPTFF